MPLGVSLSCEKCGLNLELMRLIDRQFLETPWSRQMARHLRREGYTVGRKRVRRLMAKMRLASDTTETNVCDTYLALGQGLSRSHRRDARCARC